MKKEKRKIYTKTSGLRLRKTPDTSNLKNVICELKQGQELESVKGPWLKVRAGRTEGWVHGDYVTEEILDKPAVDRRPGVTLFNLGVAHLADDLVTKRIRKIIGDEFRGGRNGWEMQCTEYVQYCVKNKLGIDIEWPVKSGRNGGRWADIFEKYRKYVVLGRPETHCAMCFTTGISKNPKINEIGHVAFVEGVYTSGTIKISEANWPRNGIYSERTLSKDKWKNKYKARFVKFR